MAEISPQLRYYIEESTRRGGSKDQITKELLDRGWKIDIINECFSNLNTATNTPQTPLPPKSSPQTEEDSHKRIVKIIVTAGSLLVGLGVYSFLAVNWQTIGNPLRIAIIILSILVSYIIGWYLREKAELPKIGNALILLGVIMYGGGIFLVAQMYDINGHMADGFVLWSLGALATGLALDFYQAYYLSLPLIFTATLRYPWQILSFSEGATPLLASSLVLIIITMTIFLSGLYIRRSISNEIADTF